VFEFFSAAFNTVTDGVEAFGAAGAADFSSPLAHFVGGVGCAEVPFAGLVAVGAVDEIAFVSEDFTDGGCFAPHDPVAAHAFLRSGFALGGAAFAAFGDFVSGHGLRGFHVSPAIIIS